MFLVVPGISAEQSKVVIAAQVSETTLKWMVRTVKVWSKG